MDSENRQVVKLLAYESPWPAHSGAAKRVLGILELLSLEYRVELVLLCGTPLSAEQQTVLSRLASTITVIPRRGGSLADKVAILWRALTKRISIHAALTSYSIHHSEARNIFRANDTCIYANFIHWADSIPRNKWSRTIFDQHNADVHFWKLYAQHTPNFAHRILALVNHWLTLKYCAQLYPAAGLVICVCDDDRLLTESAGAAAEVILSGVDCDHFRPNPRASRTGMLFTGTSAERNMVALRAFVRDVFPLVQARLPEAELVVGGNFSPEAQRELGQPGVRFTGRVDDLRPHYDSAAVFVNPFWHVYGSKLKIAEALAMGICVVSTADGVRGFPVVDGESVLVAATPRKMADCIVRALAEPGVAARIGAGGRLVAERHLDWKTVIAPRLKDQVSKFMRSSPPPEVRT